MGELFQLLYGNVKSLDAGSTLMVYPNITAGLDVKDSMGVETMYSINPDLNGDVSFQDPSGNTLAQLSEGTNGENVIDYGSGHIISGFENSLGGETYVSGFDGLIGFSAINPLGGMDYFSPSNELLMSTSPDVLGQTKINILNNVGFPLDSIKTMSEVDFGSISDGLDILNVFDWMDLF